MLPSVLNGREEIKELVMSARKVLLYPNPTLLKKANTVEHFGPSIIRLANDMFETMLTNDGVGLAAPQIGVLKRILVLREPESKCEMCLVNPEITPLDGFETGEEGCLSVPKIYAPVKRHFRINVVAQDESGNPLNFEAFGFLARIIQHETDHLNGIVFLDRLDIMTRDAKLREWKDVREHLDEPDAE
jgi:peptide deformylase